MLESQDISLIVSFISLLVILFVGINNWKVNAEAKRKDLTVELWRRWEDLQEDRSRVYDELKRLGAFFEGNRRTYDDSNLLCSESLYKVECFLRALGSIRKAKMLNETLYKDLFYSLCVEDSVWEKMSKSVNNRSGADVLEQSLHQIYQNLR